MLALEEGEGGGHTEEGDEEQVSHLQEHLVMSEIMDGIKSGRYCRKHGLYNKLNCVAMLRF